MKKEICDILNNYQIILRNRVKLKLFVETILKYDEYIYV